LPGDVEKNKMCYKNVSKEIINQLKDIVGENNILTGKEQMVNYSHDEFPLEWLRHMPDVVVKPTDALQVAKILSLANKERIPVTPRGGGTGLCGGCVPLFGGIVLSLENMNKIIEVDTRNLMAVCEAGATLASLYKEIEKEGLFFPPHPGDESATAGGVVATNAGGARAVKYGVVRNFVRGIEVVLPTGEILTLGGKIVKNSTGYNLLHLFIGSEGTLGIITKVIFNLLPPPGSIITLVVPYENLYQAISTVPKVFINKIIPLAIEFIEDEPIRIAEQHLNKKWPIEQNIAKAHLMIIVDGRTEEEVMSTAEKINNLCLSEGAIDTFIAESKIKQDEILSLRSNLYEAIKRYTLEILDIAVPISNIPLLVDKVHELAEKYHTWIPTYGHAGDGNVHVHLTKIIVEDGKFREVDRNVWDKYFYPVRDELHRYGIELGGAVSGEHGIGAAKKEYLKLAFSEKYLEILKSIKRSFDPNNILNPGKIF
jgi:glycolate oxidase